jgi:hypothetical protein
MTTKRNSSCSIDPLGNEINNRPPSSSSRIIFQWDQETSSYRKDEFNPVATEGRLTEEDIDGAFEELKKTQHYVPQKHNCCLWSALALILLGGAAFTVLLIIDDEKNSPDENAPHLQNPGPTPPS